MRQDDLTFAISSDNNLTISNIHREDGEAITVFTSVTARLLDVTDTLVAGSAITLSVTADPLTYRGVFPSTITLTLGDTYNVEATIIADGLTRLITRPAVVVNT